jgi:hypothetical protein
VIHEIEDYNARRHRPKHLIMNRTVIDERVIISAAVPQTLRAELKRRAREADCSLSGEVRRALAAYLAKHDDTKEATHAVRRP